MAEPTNIALAKALKLKNRLAGKVAKLAQTVQTYNSTQEGAERIDVRAAVARANTPIQKDIFVLAELKAEVALVAALNTKHGTVMEGYPTAGQVTYVAQFRKADVDAMTDALEARIDALQDKLDTFNAQTLIPVDAATVALGEAK